MCCPAGAVLQQRWGGMLPKGKPPVALVRRWMAPEVIEHNPYKEKADVFR